RLPLQSSSRQPLELFSLSTIYHVKITEFMRFYNVDADESDKYNAIAIRKKWSVVGRVVKFSILH
ncbi:MAG TPA: hypothetical protein VFM05_04415, partial [Candidatus Saccharimonadales bacterium]|nr:hypothetical protein [Candidatus Saccharimonadales bacterium]